MSNMKTHTLTKLLSDSPSSLNASVILKVLISLEMAENAEYASTTGSGEIKTFYRLIGDGLNYGKNILSMGHQFKSSPKFYQESFSELLELVVVKLQQEITVQKGELQ